MIHVIATVEVHPGKRESFLAEFRKIMPLVKAEVGCIEYGPAVDVAAGLPVPTSLRENVVVIVEKWENLDCLKNHLQAPHMIAYRPKVKDFVKETKLQVLAPAD